MEWSSLLIVNKQNLVSPMSKYKPCSFYTVMIVTNTVLHMHTASLKNSASSTRACVLDAREVSMGLGPRDASNLSAHSVHS